MAVSVIIPVYAAHPDLWQLTSRCIAQVIQCSPALGANSPRIILVDDFSLAPIPPHLPDRVETLVTLPARGGFAKAINAGLTRVLPGSDIILLNNDVQVSPNWIGNLQVAAHTPWAASELGTGWGKVLPTLITFVGKAPGLSGPITNNAGWWQGGHASPSAAARFFSTHLVFFCTYITAEALQALGPLSEDFGLGNWEDSEYSVRAVSKGFLPAVTPKCWVNHQASSTWKSLEGGAATHASLMASNKPIFMTKAAAYAQAWQEAHPGSSSVSNPLREYLEDASSS